MEPEDAAESLHALRFGEKCAAVSGEVETRRVNVALVAAVQEQIKDTEAAIVKNERWETRLVTKTKEKGAGTDHIRIPAAAVSSASNLCC